MPPPARQLTQAGVPGSAIRVEDQSKDTWQNAGLSLPHLREALAPGLRLAVVTKCYHQRTVYCLATGSSARDARWCSSTGSRSAAGPGNARNGH